MGISWDEYYKEEAPIKKEEKVVEPRVAEVSEATKQAVETPAEEVRTESTQNIPTEDVSSEVMQNIEEVKLLKESKPCSSKDLESGLEEITLDNNVKTVAIENMIDFSQLKVAELKNICSEKKLSGYSSLNKKELISLLENTK